MVQISVRPLNLRVSSPTKTWKDSAMFTTPKILANFEQNLFNKFLRTILLRVCFMVSKVQTKVTLPKSLRQSGLHEVCRSNRVQWSLATYDGKLISRQRLSVLGKCLFEEIARRCAFSGRQCTIVRQTLSQRRGTTMTDTVSYVRPVDRWILHCVLLFGTVQIADCVNKPVNGFECFECFECFERSIAIIYMSTVSPTVWCYFRLPFECTRRVFSICDSKEFSLSSGDRRIVRISFAVVLGCQSIAGLAM